MVIGNRAIFFALSVPESGWPIAHFRIRHVARSALQTKKQARMSRLPAAALKNYSVAISQPSSPFTISTVTFFAPER